MSRRQALCSANVLRGLCWRTALGTLASLVLLCVPVVRASAFAQEVTGAWQPGPEASGVSTLRGVVELPASGARIVEGEPFQVSGWVVDSTAQGWAGIDELQVYDGPHELDGRLLVKGTVAMPRPDVGTRLDNPFWAASGFGATVPSPGLDTGTHHLVVAAHTPGKGWWYQSLVVDVVHQPPTVPVREPRAALVGLLLVAQLTLGPLAALVPGLRASYLAHWARWTGGQLAIALLGLLVLAPRLQL